MEIYQVSPEKIVKLRECRKKDILYQMERLRHEGQIEPIVVIPTEDGQFRMNEDHHEFWHYSVELVEAAIELKWDEILITY
jgi:hypothetical protein